MDAVIGFVVLGKGPRNIKYFAGETYSSKICSDLRVCWSALAYSLPIHVHIFCLCMSTYVYICEAFSAHVNLSLSMSIFIYVCLSMSMFI